MNERMIEKVLRDYEEKRLLEKIAQEKRIEEVYRAVPRVQDIEIEISRAASRTMCSVLSGSENFERDVEKLQSEMERLSEEKRLRMKEAGFSEDYMDLRFQCSDCRDTGYTEEGKRCHCLIDSLRRSAYQDSNLKHLLDRENFETFDLSLFSEKPFGKEKLSPRDNMSEILKICQRFVTDFPRMRNLFFYGGTGLGKTFLSSAITKTLLDAGKSVVYESILDIVEICEARRFQGGDRAEFRYRMLFEADLLVIDDLGTEMVNSFTNTEFFHILNDRIVNGKRMLISSNLGPKEISNVYSERIVSRLLSDFYALKFYGEDLRWKIRR